MRREAVKIGIKNKHTIGGSDADHTELTAISAENLVVLQTLAAAIMSPVGPCSLNPALLSDPSLKLKGSITAGAKNVLVGDE